MHKPIKYVEKAVTVTANVAWQVFDRLNQISQNPSFTPKWSDKPLLKSYEKQKPTLGWPRETDSLCPKCIPELRNKVVNGDVPVEVLLNEKRGEIKARSIEKDGKIIMEKECPIHGKFDDLMSIDPAFSKHLEDVFPGRDIRAHNDDKLHNHGSSTITHGRGSVLTIDLTNRCNMMCDPCFMDANQVGFVHELTWEDIKTMLDNAISPVASRRCRRTSWTRFVIRVRLATTRCRPPRTALSSPRARNSVSRPLKPVCVTPTCSSTAWATKPTATAAWATCST
jgi:hypothetical protein